MLTVRIPDDLRDAIDAVRGDVPRERWVRGILQSAAAHAGIEQRTAMPSPTEVPPTPPQGDKRYNRPTGYTPRPISPCPDCGKANGVHKGDCPSHPGRQR